MAPATHAKQLWTQIPPGACPGCGGDLTRQAGAKRDGPGARSMVEDLARNRLQTMREVISFVDAADDAPWEKGPWDTAVITWEADQAHQEAERKAAEKAAKAAAAKAKREAAAAAKAAAEAWRVTRGRQTTIRWGVSTAVDAVVA